MKKSIFILLVAGCSILLSGCKEEPLAADFQTDKLYSYLPYITNQEVRFSNGENIITYKVEEGGYGIENGVVESYWPQGTHLPYDKNCPEYCEKHVQLLSTDSMYIRISASCIGRKKVTLSCNWQQGVWRNSHGEAQLTTNDVAKIYEIMTDSVPAELTHHHALFVRNEGLVYYTDSDGKRWEVVKE